MSGSYIGEVEFSAVTNEDVKYENEVTDRPVENLDYIADHVKNKPIKFSIVGVIAGDNAGTSLQLLKEYRVGKEVLKYAGRTLFEDVVIENFSISYHKNIENGFEFSLECKIIKRADSQVMLMTTPKVVTQARGSKNRGKVTTRTKEVAKEKYEYYKAKEKQLLEEDFGKKRVHGGGCGYFIEHGGSGTSF